MRGGFWTGLMTGALLGASLVVLFSPEARSRLADMTGDLEMGNVGRRVGRAAQRVARRAGLDEVLEEMT